MKSLTVKPIESPLPRMDPNIRIQELHKENENLKYEMGQLKKTISSFEQKNQEMLKNEIQYRNVIKSYQNDLKKKSAGVLLDVNEKISTSIMDSHRELTENIGRMQQKVDDIISNREEILVAVYNSKLRDINRNLEQEKKEKFEYVEGLAEREHMLSKELQMLKGSVGVIEAKNSHLEKENKNLKLLAKVKDLEINELHKKMSEYKKSSLKFPSIKSAKNLEIKGTTHNIIKTTSSAVETDNIEDDTGKRYQKVIAKLQKLLMIEKNNVRAARNAYFRELSSRSDIEDTIISCIEEIKKEKASTKPNHQSAFYLSLSEKLVNSEVILKRLQEFLSQKVESP